MKETWKVYIKGVPGRGNEVIKALTNLGAKNPFDYKGNMVYLYYIWHDGSIHVELIDNEYGRIIIDNYHEIKLPKKWKDGDILISKDNVEYTIFKEYIYNALLRTYNFSVICKDKEDILWYKSNEENLYGKGAFRLATSEEIEQFHNILHKKHKEWDVEKKQLVDWKWKPNERDYYYYISSLGKVIRTTYLDTDSDKSSFDFGNCFCTEEEANTMAEKIKKLLKGEEL